MAESVRNLQKQGAKTRAINASIKEAMRLIEEKRKQKKEAEEEAIRIKKEQLNNENNE